MRDLSRGLRGQDVKQWQQFLIAQGLLKTKATGLFADHTERATRAFQRAHGLEVDGVVGEKTRERALALGEKIGAGDAISLPAVENQIQSGLFDSIAPTEEEPVAEVPADPPADPPTIDDSMSLLTEEMLKQVMPGSSPTNRANYLPFLQQAMQEFEINQPPRIAAFLAQLAHESGQLKFMEEIWGPTPAQLRYEPPTNKARALGNTEPGDGLRFKGRGPIQLTGRDNYRRYGDILAVDLVAQPKLAATKEVGFRIAGLFWKKNGLNELADEQRFELITKRINGGTLGLAHRQKFFGLAKQAFHVPQNRSFDLGVEDDDAPPRFTRGLDEPGEITPTAEERNPAVTKVAASAASSPAARPATKTATKKAPQKATKKATGKRAPANQAAAKRAPAKKAVAKPAPLTRAVQPATKAKAASSTKAAKPAAKPPAKLVVGRRSARTAAQPPARTAKLGIRKKR